MRRRFWTARAPPAAPMLLTASLCLALSTSAPPGLVGELAGLVTQRQSRANRAAVVLSAGGGGEDGSGSGSASTFEATAAPVRWLVGSLTAAVNAVAAEPPRAPSPPPAGPPIALSALLDGVRADYEDRQYLWTGDIDASLYDSDCVFTDPTLSFRGLERFQQNIANLTPILEALLGEREVELFSCERVEGQPQLRARWRMYGEVRLPWRPAIDLTGQTVFTFDPSRGNRIVDYAESWDIPASAALAQLLRPAPRRGA